MSTTTKRTLRARVSAFFWGKSNYVSGWIDGAITGAFLFAVVMALIGGAA